MLTTLHDRSDCRRAPPERHESAVGGPIDTLGPKSLLHLTAKQYLLFDPNLTTMFC